MLPKWVKILPWQPGGGVPLGLGTSCELALFLYASVCVAAPFGRTRKHGVCVEKESTVVQHKIPEPAKINSTVWSNRYIQRVVDSESECGTRERKAKPLQHKQEEMEDPN